MKKYIYLLALTLFMVSCSGLLDTDNPNNLLEEDLDDPRAFFPMVNGAETATNSSYGAAMALYATASDEVVWIGSRDAWNQLDMGNLTNPNNEFVDGAFPTIGQARWWTDDVIRRGESFISDGFDISETDLARAYIYGAINYTMIADMFDDFVVSSSKKDAGIPVGPGNMNSLYDVGMAYADKGQALGGADASLKPVLAGLKAKAAFNKELWAKYNPVNTSDPLVNSSAVADLAQQALDMMASDSYVWKLDSDPSAPATSSSLGGNINARKEMRLSDTYVISSGTTVADLGSAETSISLKDPIDDVPDPALYTLVKEFTEEVQWTDYTIVSGRLMRLIIAEVALANGEMEKFTENINAVRALDGLTPYDGQIDAIEMLKHERRVNLFLQGARMADHYRFGEPSEYWSNDSDAVTSPGAMFPITITEIRANPNIN